MPHFKLLDTFFLNIPLINTTNLSWEMKNQSWSHLYKTRYFSDIDSQNQHIKYTIYFC